MKNLFLGIVLLLLSLYACHPSVDFALEGESSKLVIWSVLHPDSTASAFLSKTLPPLSKNVDNRIKDGVIILFENNNAIDTLREDSTGHYVSKKGFKPREGNIYQIVASKEGFMSIKTPRDTMPQKPIIKKMTFEDSARTKNGRADSRITIITDKPSHFINYGFGRHVTLGVPWQPDTSLSGAPFSGSPPFLEDLNATCAQNGSFVFLGSRDLGYYFTLPNCKYSSTYYELYKPAKYEERYMKTAKFKFTVAAITYTGVDMMIALNKVTSQYGDYYSGINIFWSPVQLPDYIENGYGYFVCYNTTNVVLPAR